VKLTLHAWEHSRPKSWHDHDFTISLGADGSATWSGSNARDRDGVFRGTVAKSDFERCVDLLVASAAYKRAVAGQGFISESSHIPNVRIDLAFSDGTTVTIRHGTYTDDADPETAVLPIVQCVEQVGDGLAWSPTASEDAQVSEPAEVGLADAISETGVAAPKGLPIVVQPSSLPTELVLTFDDGHLGVNGSAIPFPAELENMFKLLGPPSRQYDKSNVIYVWDELGLRGYERPGSGQITSITVSYTDEHYEFSPRMQFRGEVVLPLGVITAKSTVEDLKAVGLAPEIHWDDEMWLGTRMGKSAVGAQVEGAVRSVSLSWTGMALGEGFPPPTPDMPLFTAKSRDYGFPFDEVVTETSRNGNVSEVRIDTYDNGIGGYVGRSMFTAGAIGELAARLGFLYLVKLREGPVADAPGAREGSGWTMVVGFTNVAAPDVATEFPEYFDASVEYLAAPADMVRRALGDWKKVDAGKADDER
jgi:hypothetical protein